MNHGKITHAIEVEGGGAGGKDVRSADIAPGQSATITVDLKAGKTYEWYCPIDGHKGLGMKGTIKVAGSTASASAAPKTTSGSSSGNTSSGSSGGSEGGAQYALLCREDGGVLDDLFTYRLAGETFLTVTNAANHARDVAWLLEQAEDFDVDVIDVADRFAMLAVQGPDARGIVRPLADGELPSRMHVCERRVGGVPALVCGTGYTGEDGVELLLDPAGAGEVWDAMVAGGAAPAGLAARA